MVAPFLVLNAVFSVASAAVIDPAWRSSLAVSDSAVVTATTPIPPTPVNAIKARSVPPFSWLQLYARGDGTKDITGTKPDPNRIYFPDSPEVVAARQRQREQQEKGQENADNFTTGSAGDRGDGGVKPGDVVYGGGQQNNGQIGGTTASQKGSDNLEGYDDGYFFDNDWDPVDDQKSTSDLGGRETEGSKSNNSSGGIDLSCWIDVSLCRGRGSAAKPKSSSVNNGQGSNDDGYKNSGKGIGCWLGPETCPKSAGQSKGKSSDQKGSGSSAGNQTNNGSANKGSNKATSAWTDLTCWISPRLCSKKADSVAQPESTGSNHKASMNSNKASRAVLSDKYDEGYFIGNDDVSKDHAASNSAKEFGGANSDQKGSAETSASDPLEGYDDGYFFDHEWPAVEEDQASHGSQKQAVQGTQDQNSKENPSEEYDDGYFFDSDWPAVEDQGSHGSQNQGADVAQDQKAQADQGQGSEETPSEGYDDGYFFDNDWPAAENHGPDGSQDHGSKENASKEHDDIYFGDGDGSQDVHAASTEVPGQAATSAPGTDSSSGFGNSNAEKSKGTQEGPNSDNSGSIFDATSGDGDDYSDFSELESDDTEDDFDSDFE